MSDKPASPLLGDPLSTGTNSRYTTAQQALLDEHQEDRCEYEMGQCLSGCRPSCPPAYCTSERHGGDTAPDWPCRVVAPILGFRNAADYWRAQDALLDAYYASLDVEAS